jgi:ATP-binding cassette subfamily F protein 3
LLLGRINHFEGQVRLAANVIYGHMGQHVSFADENRTLLTELLSRSDLDEGQARSLLARYGFRDVDVFKSIKVLSGGERSRLYLSCLLLERPDLLFLDEPTNHLDITSREILEQALVDFPGSILAVSHDRYFIERCTRQVFGFVGDRVLPFDTFSEYRQAVRLSETRPVAVIAAAAAINSRHGLPEKPTSPPNRAQERREIARSKEAIRSMEKSIAAREAEKAELEAGFSMTSEPAAYHRYTDVLAELEKLYDEYVGME